MSARCERAAARARNIATSQQGAAVEAELDVLSRSPLSDEEWLDAVASLNTGRRPSLSVVRPGSGLRIHALLLLRDLQPVDLARSSVQNLLDFPDLLRRSR